MSLHSTVKKEAILKKDWSKWFFTNDEKNNDFWNKAME